MAGLGEIPRPPDRRSAGPGRDIHFAVNRGLALVLTEYVEGDIIRYSEIFTPFGLAICRSDIPSRS
ncbi:hypothetical protein ABT126_37920 [Streptomyces sp. NPDC002012]|uniref:hypothetical protein n=1 Tax=unclassified Streptomyces TaxID=2593676 RepID=UPI003322796C